MTPPQPAAETLRTLDEPTAALVRLSAIVTAGNEPQIRDAIVQLTPAIPPQWVEELLLQCYLFAGFPRALNATREWRKLRPEPFDPPSPMDPAVWRADGERTCAAVYGVMYDRLRENIRALHPRLDDWMITEGYGKVLSRPGLDLGRRELCIVAACAAAEQDRQLHSHLHGALNVGVDRNVIGAVIQHIGDLLGPDRLRSVQLLWGRVQGK